LKRFDLKELATPFLEGLAAKTNEIIHLAVLDKNQIIYIDKRGKEQVLTVATRIGGRHLAYCSAMGKVLLAGLPQERLNEVLAMGPLRRFTPTTITQVLILRKELERVQKQGFAIDNEESFAGIKCVAAPIGNNQGEVVAAISATVPKLRMGKERTKELIQLVTQCAQRISERMKSVR
jgi:DNA-binding IclR family transcriptional regulator